MKLFKKTVVTLATAAALVSAGSASAFLSNWYLDTNGAAAGGGVAVGEYLDMTGSAYVHNTFTSASTFLFNEAGHFSAFTADAFNPLPNALSASFTGSGTGSTGASGGNLHFTSGTLSVFDVSKNLIGTFALTHGGGALEPATVLPNGHLSLAFKATFLAPGYFFDSEGGTDLSNIVSNPDGLVFGFATTNASLVTSPRSIGQSLAANSGLYAETFGGVPSIENYGVENLIIANNGQYRLQVPEPASLALAGIALLGLGATRRRAAK